MSFIPEEFYVGFTARGSDELLGFFTPNGTDASATKRKATVDNWASKKIKSAVFKNEPMSGFRIVDTARRGGRSNNVLFRVIHPAVGAEFEITAENLNTLHQQSIIEYGEIKTELLLARNGNNNVLIVKDSDEHKATLKAMEKDKAKQAAIASISKKDIKVLDTVDLVTEKSSFVYLGFSEYSYFKSETNSIGHNYYSKSYVEKHELINEKIKHHIFARFSSDNKVQLKIVKTFPKISKVTSGNNHITTVSDIENKEITYIYKGSYDYISHPKLFNLGVANPDDFELYFESIGQLNSNDIVKKRNYQHTVVLQNNEYYIFSDERTYHNKKLSLKYKIKLTDDFNYNIQDLVSNANKSGLIALDPIVECFVIKVREKVKP